MSMQIEYFLNWCQGIIDLYLVWFNDANLQRNSWFKKNPPISSFDDVVEGFIADVKELLTTPEYEHYANDPACLLLKELYQKVEKYYFNIESVQRSLSEEQLLNDREWIEIQELAKGTTDGLLVFINRLQNNNGKYND